MESYIQMRPVVEPCAGDRPIVKREAERPDEMEGDSQPYAKSADCARVVRDFRPQENDGEILPHDAILERKAGKQLLNRDHQEEAGNQRERGRLFVTVGMCFRNHLVADDIEHCASRRGQEKWRRPCKDH